MNCAAVIARYLAAAGIKHVFGYPGDPNVELMETLRTEGIDFVLTRREGTAGLMAEAYGQITGLPGVCMTTLGPGSSNLTNAVAGALLDRIPMLAISGQIEGKRQRTFTHQVLNHDLLFGPITKWTTDIRPDTVSQVMRKGIRTAMAERPGPVHITTAADVIGAEASDDEILLPPLGLTGHGLSVYAMDGRADPAKIIAAAKKPMILAGIAAVRAGAGPELTRLAETLGCPVIVAPMAKGIVNETHPYFAGTLDMACNDYMWDFLGTADLILAIGFDAVELIKPWAPTAPVIHIDMTPNTDQIYPASIELVGPIAATLAMLSEGLSGGLSGNPRWAEAEIKRHRDGLFEAFYAGRVPGKLNPTDVIDVVREAMPLDTVVTSDVGSHKLLVGQGWTTHAPKGVLMTNGLSSMGYSLPAAMTARLIDRTRPVVCFTGDGGLAMVQGELRLASSLGLDFTVVVFCDNSLNRIELKQMARQYPSWGTLIEPTDIVMLAESMGCAGVATDNAADLARILADGGPGDRPLVIGATIDPAQYAAQF
jgi:acetolactate synthase-1/2/3 large subunit